MNFAARNASAPGAPAAATATGGSFSMGRRMLGLGLAATVLAAGAYAYTAQNTFDDAGRAGDGSAAISGYHVTGVQYTLDATDPSLIDKVSFTLDAPASTAKASIDTGTYVDCQNATGTNDWTCDLAPNPGVLGAADLNVVAVS